MDAKTFEDLAKRVGLEVTDELKAKIAFDFEILLPRFRYVIQTHSEALPLSVAIALFSLAIVVAQGGNVPSAETRELFEALLASSEPTPPAAEPA